MEKWNSRKLIFTAISFVLLIAVPVVFQKLGIGESVTMLVVGAIATEGLGYKITNAYQKKFEPAREV